MRRLAPYPTYLEQLAGHTLAAGTTALACMNPPRATQSLQCSTMVYDTAAAGKCNGALRWRPCSGTPPHNENNKRVPGPAHHNAGALGAGSHTGRQEGPFKSTTPGWPWAPRRAALPACPGTRGSGSTRSACARSAAPPPRTSAAPPRRRSARPPLPAPS